MHVFGRLGNLKKNEMFKKKCVISDHSALCYNEYLKSQEILQVLKWKTPHFKIE
jgi:hypothetical protein